MEIQYKVLIILSFILTVITIYNIINSYVRKYEIEERLYYALKSKKGIEEVIKILEEENITEDTKRMLKICKKMLY